MDEEYTKLPRLYTPETFLPGTAVQLSPGQAHYLRAVLRRDEGAMIRIFNGRDGEYAARLSAISKKSAICVPESLIRPQEEESPLHLFFCPIKKNRMEILIEKAVELGVSDIHPVLSARTETRKLNTERLNAQITEAAEQCERLSLPVLHPVKTLHEALRQAQRPKPLLWCRERGAAKPLADFEPPPAWAFLIGPEGGFTEDETALLESAEDVAAVSLGPRILRSETAALGALAFAVFSKTS